MINNTLVKSICDAAMDKKAQDVTVIDIRELSVIADSFVICSGSSKSQVKAICDGIEEKLAKANVKPIKIDGYNEARWIVLDYADVLVHIFYDEDRLFYNLERLWNNGDNTFVFKNEL